MTRLGVLTPIPPCRVSALSLRWTPRALIALSCLIGCGPAIKTQSLRLEEASPLWGTRIETTVTPPHAPTATVPAVSAQSPLRFEPTSAIPPFVYRVIESPSSDHPLFALTLQSCGKLTHQHPLGNARLLFSGLGKVQVTPDREITIGSEQFPLQTVEAQLEGEQVFVRVLSITSPDCLTDFVVWSSDNVRLTDRAIPVIEQLLIRHREHVAPASPKHETPPT